jgi:hypothetical protein
MGWLGPAMDVFALQLALGCLLIVPAFQWSIGARSFFPPPGCALAAILVIVECLFLTHLGSFGLPAIGGLAEAGLAAIVFSWCGSLAFNARRMASGLRAQRDTSEDARTCDALHNELLRDAILAVRACHTVSLVHRSDLKRRGRASELVKAA